MRSSSRTPAVDVRRRCGCGPDMDGANWGRIIASPRAAGCTEGPDPGARDDAQAFPPSSVRSTVLCRELRGGSLWLLPGSPLRALDDLVELVLHDPVALAGCALQPLAVDDDHVTAVVRDQTGLLED